MDQTFEIFLATQPGLEEVLRDEASALGFADPVVSPGGVSVQGGWPDVWRANIDLRGASKVLARIGSFRVHHLAQLDKRARKFDWAAILRPGEPVRVDVTCKNSRIYHDRAARQRIEEAIHDVMEAPISAEAKVRIMARIEDDLLVLSVDTSGAPLHRRGHKEFVGKAPMRETLAAQFLRQCGYDGLETVVDPMCGSGTFVLEAAEIALGLRPGRDREFAFEHLASFDPQAVADLRQARAASVETDLRFYGYDRDDGAIRGSMANAKRAGLEQYCLFARAAISDLQPPKGPPGLVMVNPPYGARIGNRKLLFGLYGALGTVLSERFQGWRVGLITSEAGLAKATGLRFLPVQSAVSFGGIRVTLYRTDPL